MQQASNQVQQVPTIDRPLASVLAVTAGLFRIIPHTFNLTPVGALGLFGGARLRSWQAFALPLAVMLVTDACLWVMTGFDPEYAPFHSSRSFVYPSFLLYVLIGRLLVNTESPWRIGLASLLGSLQFFLLTNLGTWATEDLYPRTLGGLLTCYVAGLPFYSPTLLGDLSCTAALFGLHALLTRTAFPAERVPVLAK